MRSGAAWPQRLSYCAGKPRSSSNTRPVAPTAEAATVVPVGRLATLTRMEADGSVTPTQAKTILEAMLAGQRELHADDDALTAAAGATFDALYAAPATAATGSQGVPP